jgi:hypothetical protein
LIDPSDGLNLMSNFNSFFKSFSFYQMISNCHYNLNLIFILSLVSIFNLSTKYVPSIPHNQMALYSLPVMLLDQSKTKLRYLKHLPTYFQLEDLLIKVTPNQSNNRHFSGRFCTLQWKIHISQCTDPNGTKFGEDVLH